MEPPVKIFKKFKKPFKNLKNYFTLQFFQLTFATGVYTGIYISQNYEIPRVDEPARLWERFKQWADSYKKDEWANPFQVQNVIQ